MVSSTLCAAILLMLAVTTRCNGDTASRAATPTVMPGTKESCYCLEDVLEEDLYNAASVVFHRKPDHEMDHVMVIEQRGVIAEYSMDKNMDKKTVLDIKSRVVTSSDYGESRGLLSAVPDPHFETNGRVFVYYSSSDIHAMKRDILQEYKCQDEIQSGLQKEADIKLMSCKHLKHTEFAWGKSVTREDGGEEYAYVSMFQATDGVLDPLSERVLLRVRQPFIHGNGGPMLFGSDGYLYIVTGDGGGQDDTNGYAQSKKTFYGKVLRLDVSGSQDFPAGHSAVAKMYSVPKDNPFLNDATALPEVWALGFRNMWGCSQDSRPGGSGKIFCAETGTNQFDEINVIERGKNYGWNVKEGNACRNSGPCGPIENEGVPIHNFKHNSSHALVGGFVYRGKGFSWMDGQGLYVFGDVISGQTFMLKEESNMAWTDYRWPICSDLDLCSGHAKARPLQHLLAFGQDTSGELYLLMARDLVPTTKTAKLLKMVPNKTNSSSRLQSPPPSATLIGLILVMVKSMNMMF
ncbi:hhip-like protein 1 [Plakobranchus ocellatus]|uniref:Hhip-like protein 1 n=1 Tax=Plakobranchus ocellatus TaxID=259542 RepID=A0AAV3YIC7_9GAST|nr:hhip-like protein 1 [Plakobranchus ocellatus]